MRFHLVDRILEWEPATSVRARKVCSRGEEFWVGEGDDLVMPPPLVLESFCQAGTWLVMLTTDTQKRAALLSIGSVEFLADVRPGDVIVGPETWRLLDGKIPTEPLGELQLKGLQQKIQAYRVAGV